MARQSPLLAELDEIMALRSNEDVLELGKKTGERGLDETNEKRKEAKERAAAQAEAQAEAKKQAMLQDKTAQEDMETVMIGDSTASATKGAPTITSPDVDELHVSASSNNLNGASPLSGAAAGEQARVGGIIQKASGSTNVA
ncbi:hypothetical protein FRB97_004115 [Tulasnella sp. 331]|nr:hypothetical protein FRB97_004115 [Tulasnella sp. 331]KAG8889841.1 hypothetical protein FRB98_002490 [Tulasnella sp. 332]